MIRNNDSSADNTSDEQLHSDEVLMSKIEDMVVVLIRRTHREHTWKEDRLSTRTAASEIIKLLQTHKNTVSTAVKQKDDNLVDEDELRFKIELLLGKLETESEYDSYLKFCNTEITNKKDITDELLELFKTYQNSVLRPCKD